MSSPFALRRRSAFGALLLSFAGLAHAQTPAATSEGLTYRVRVSTEVKGLPDFGGRGGATGGQFFLGRVSAAGNQARIEVQAMEPATGAFVAGDYILHTDTGAVVVQPDKSTYRVFTGLSGGGGRAGRGGGGFGGMGPTQMSPDQVRNLNVTGSRVVIEKQGRDSVEGRAVQKYKVSYEFSVIIGTEPRTIQAENEIWALPGLAVRLVNPLSPGGPTVGMFALPADTTGLPPGILRFARQMDSVMKQVEGTPLKTVTTMNLANLMPANTQMAGLDIKLVQTTTFSAITPARIDPGLFVIPAGYTRTP